MYSNFWTNECKTDEEVEAKATEMENQWLARVEEIEKVFDSGMTFGPERTKLEVEFDSLMWQLTGSERKEILQAVMAKAHAEINGYDGEVGIFESSSHPRMAMLSGMYDHAENRLRYATK